MFAVIHCYNFFFQIRFFMKMVFTSGNWKMSYKEFVKHSNAIDLWKIKRSSAILLSELILRQFPPSKQCMANTHRDFNKLSSIL